MQEIVVSPENYETSEEMYKKHETNSTDRN